MSIIEHFLAFFPLAKTAEIYKEELSADALKYWIYELEPGNRFYLTSLCLHAGISLKRSMEEADRRMSELVEKYGDVDFEKLFVMANMTPPSDRGSAEVFCKYLAVFAKYLMKPAIKVIFMQFALNNYTQKPVFDYIERLEFVLGEDKTKNIVRKYVLDTPILYTLSNYKSVLVPKYITQDEYAESVTKTQRIYEDLDFLDFRFPFTKDNVRAMIEKAMHSQSLQDRLKIFKKADLIAEFWGKDEAREVVVELLKDKRVADQFFLNNLEYLGHLFPPSMNDSGSPYMADFMTILRRRVLAFPEKTRAFSQFIYPYFLRKKDNIGDELIRALLDFGGEREKVDVDQLIDRTIEEGRLNQPTDGEI